MTAEPYYSADGVTVYAGDCVDVLRGMPAASVACIGVEREPAYLPLIVARLSKPLAVGLDFGEAS